MAEIIRSALSSVDRGQWDAAKSVGFSYWQTMRHVIVPQSVRIALPPLANVMLDLVKASSLAAMITVGFFIALGRMSGLALLRWPARIYISFMRGVPILVILFILYFGFPYIGIQFTALAAALIGFSINSAA
ncbi:ABC transporter permease subunit [Bacillus licheniformis]|nr:ABC transporter permease subunit [Bacillus licheniformis]